MEDLERRAASSSGSPSPETSHAELDPRHRASRLGGFPPQALGESYAPTQGYEYMLSSHQSHPDDKGMFSYQHTRQLSTSPPPLISYQSQSSTMTMRSSETPDGGYFSLPPSTSDSSYHLAPNSGYTTGLPSASPSWIKQEYPNIKQEVYEEEDDMNPFSLSYASMAGVDPQSYNNYQSTPLTLVSRPLTFLVILLWQDQIESC